MIVNPGPTRLRARTVVIDDPGSLGSFMTPTDSTCMLHRGDGVVGIGEIARFETDSPAAADVWWEAFCAELENETELPGVFGTGPVAFGSFTFDPDRSSSRSVMIVPRTIIGRRYGQSWLTQFSYDRVVSDPPRRQIRPRRPPSIDLTDGAISAQRWRQVAAQAQYLLIPGGLERLVIMRDMLATSPLPIDPRWIVGALSRRFPDAWTYHVAGAVGTTSKLTVQVRDGLVTSRALTHAPGRRPQTEELLLDALVGDGPLAAQHAEIVNAVRDALAPFCQAWHRPETPGLVAGPDASYLVSDVSGVTTGATSSLTILSALHPTAFVTGTPPWRAQAVLAEVEELDRGRVSGPVGWVDAMGNGQWLSDCRGGQLDAVDPRILHVFLGQPVGIDDDPDALAADLESQLATLTRLVTRS